MSVIHTIRKRSIHDGEKVFLVKTDGLTCCYQNGIKGIVLCYDDGKIEHIGISLELIEKNIPELWRCHRKYLINLNFLNKITFDHDGKNDYLLVNGLKIPIDYERKKILMLEIEKYAI